jgi:simple sugar transport system ATP-binding protein
VDRVAAELVKDFDVRTPSIDLPASTLSGGNQQKVIVAREFSRPIKLLIAAQPTRGLDVGSIEYIHGRIIEKRDEGTAVLVVSTELDEIRALSDRIAVMFEGRIVDILPANRVTKEQLGLLMAGVRPEDLPVSDEDAPIATDVEAVL